MFLLHLIKDSPDVFFLFFFSRTINLLLMLRSLWCQISTCFLLGWSNSILNTIKAVEIFITGILTDFTNLEMQRRSWKTCQLRD